MDTHNDNTEQLQEQNCLIDLWVQQLSHEKNLHRRRELFRTFDTSRITIGEAQTRLDHLSIKINAPVQRNRIYSTIVGIISLAFFIAILIYFYMIGDSGKPFTDFMGYMTLALITGFLITLIWCIVWKILIAREKKSPDSIYNLRNI